MTTHADAIEGTRRDLNNGDFGLYRDRIREFITANAPRGEYLDGIRVPRSAEAESELRQWYSALFSEGYIGGSWPIEWGGTDQHSPRHDAIVMEEIVRARAPRPIDQVLLASHLILSFGTTEQKSRYLPRIRAAEDIWCQLFSEPGVGSDLAALTTRAEELSDGTFRVNGQKVWTTDAQWAQMGVLLARTDTGGRPHAGISVFLLDMSLPGVEVRPIREMTGSDEFCEVYFNDVVVTADQLLGTVNGGWGIVNSGLASERAYVGANAVVLDLLMDDLLVLARSTQFAAGPAIDDPVVRDALADFVSRTAGVQLIAREVVERIIAKTEHPADGLMAKVAYTELNVALCSYAQRLTAMGEVGESGRTAAERLQQALLWSRALTISGGSSEIIRSLIATQLLGLPKSWTHR